ncbi:hypothetical protein BS50DRAFT_620613 [Corynespora cassiicola Philippines]|uniref:Uncharacterized protein n=1 Tax=Corynespora cassiicola Philippines TaxID=1448308 RepID=A0A2T2NS39_CORCC|nr:hypothetical protein BS50DRAFT_620613 [Corynespora cassiicola Philippines]
MHLLQACTSLLSFWQSSAWPCILATTLSTPTFAVPHPHAPAAMRALADPRDTSTTPTLPRRAPEISTEKETATVEQEDVLLVTIQTYDDESCTLLEMFELQIRDYECHEAFGHTVRVLHSNPGRPRSRSLFGVLGWDSSFVVLPLTFDSLNSARVRSRGLSRQANGPGNVKSMRQLCGFQECEGLEGLRVAIDDTIRCPRRQIRFGLTITPTPLSFISFLPSISTSKVAGSYMAMVHTSLGGQSGERDA